MFQCFISNLHEDIASFYVSQNMKILNILYNLIFTIWERERERERERDNANDDDDDDDDAEAIN